jgi:hypothetical protein
MQTGDAEADDFVQRLLESLEAWRPNAAELTVVQAQTWPRLLQARKQVHVGTDQGHPHQVTEFLVQCLRGACADAAGTYLLTFRCIARC